MPQRRRRLALLLALATVTSCTDETTFTDAAPGPDGAGVDGATDPDAAIDGGLDVTPPDTTVTAGPEDPTADALATLTFSADEPATFECQLDGDGFAACTSPFERTVADGDHVFEVRATDDAGNVELAPAQHLWRTDTIAPDTTITAAPPAVDNSVDVSFAFSADEAGDFECAIDGAAFASCTSPHAVMGLTDGVHTFAVRAVDLAGNLDPTPATHTWTLDSSSPDTTIDSGPDGDVNVTDATFTFSSPDAGVGATFACRLDAGAFAPCTSPHVYAGLAEGDHTFQVRVTDAVGNPDPTPATRSWTIDLTNPETTIDSGPTGTVDSDAPVFTFSAAVAEDTFECRLDGAAFAPCTTPRGYTNLADGAHVFDVRAIDAAGNVDPTPASRSWTIDTIAPDTMITAAPVSPSNVVSPAFSFTSSEPGSTFACQVDGGAFVACTSAHVVNGLVDGSHTFAVRATDGTGHVDPTPATHTWTRDTLGPTVQAVSSTTPDGRYGAGAVVLIQVTFSEAMLVTGSPTLLLETGGIDRAATLVGGGGTATLTFSYTVQAEDISADLDYHSTAALAGGTLRDAAGNDAIRTLAAPGAAGSLGAARAIVIAASTPVMTSVVVTPATAYTDTTLTCTPAATDADGDVVTYAYAWLRNAAVIAGATSNTLAGSNFAEGESIACRVTPSDGTASGAAMTSAAVTIANTAPVMTSVVVTPTPAYTDTTLTCTPAASDADGEAVSYTYAWLRNAAVIAGATSNTLAGSNFAEGESIACRVTPSDGTASGAAMTSAAVTIANTAPVVTGVSLTPATAYTNSSMTCTPAGYDADGEAFSYQYAWLRNNVLVVGATSSTLDGSNFVEGDAIQCVVAPFDGTATGASMGSNTVGISNSAPTFPTSVTLTPFSPTTNDTLTCTPAGATDADEGDSLFYTYRWGRNGAEIIGQTGSTLAPGNFAAGDAIACEAAAHDGTVAGPAALSNTVQIAPGATCSPGPQLGCGATMQGHTASGADVINTYSCVGWDESGPEVAYVFSATQSGQATATLSGLGADLDVFVVQDAGLGCVPGNCVAFGDNAASFATTPGATYYVIVDGYQGASGSYVLNLGCQ